MVRRVGLLNRTLRELKCYDEAEKRREAEQLLTVQESRDTPSLMGGRWELDPGTDHGIFSIRPHKQAYLLPARTTNNVNNQPSSPTHSILQNRWAISIPK